MGALGRQPGAGIRSLFTYTASGGETSLSGADDNGKTLTYADSKYLDVYLNGTLLVPGQDYEATTRTSVDSISPALDANDVVVIMAYDVFTIADHYTKSEVLANRVGEIVIRLGSKSGDEVVLDGSTYSKSQLPELWAYAQDSGNLGTDDANFEDIDASTFRVPNLVTNERFLRAVGPDDVGREQGDAIRNITGRASFRNSEDALGVFGEEAPQGVFTYDGSTGSGPLGSALSEDAGWRLEFDASNEVPTANENRPTNTGILTCMKAGRVV